MSDKEKADEREARRRFAREHGVLRTGLPLGILIAFIVAHANRTLTLDYVLSWRFIAAAVIDSFVMGSLGRYVYGPIMWKMFGEYNYRQQGGS